MKSPHLVPFVLAHLIIALPVSPTQGYLLDKSFRGISSDLALWKLSVSEDRYRSNPTVAEIKLFMSYGGYARRA